MENYASVKEFYGLCFLILLAAKLYSDIILQFLLLWISGMFNGHTTVSVWMC